MFKDEQRDTVWNEVRQHDLRSFGDLLTPAVFANASRRACLKIGTSALNLANLAWLGIACAKDTSLKFSTVLKSTQQFLEDQQGYFSTSLGKAKSEGLKKDQKNRAKGQKSKNDPRRNDPTTVTEEAFVQARQKVPMAFWAALLLLLVEKFQEQHGQLVQLHGLRLLSLDGTTFETQKWAALRDKYGVPKNGSRGQRAPQARMVMLMFVTVRIPMSYVVGPNSQSEQAMARSLLNQLQANDLLLMDRGFFSFGIFWQIQNRNAFFGIRLKKGIHFRTIEKLGHKDRLVEWKPKHTRSKWKEQGLPPAIKLRVIDYQIKGFRKSAVVTNLLDPRRVPRDEWVRLAEDCHDQGELKPGLYHRRWEIETAFSELKVTMNAEFRSRTPASFEFELAGRIVYYLLVRWLIVKAAEKHKIDPLRLSFSSALEELDLVKATMLISTPEWIATTLLPRLLDRIASHVVPLRPGRHYARPNDTKPKNKGKGRVQKPAKLASTKFTSNRRRKFKPLNKNRLARNKA